MKRCKMHSWWIGWLLPGPPLMNISRFWLNWLVCKFPTVDFSVSWRKSIFQQRNNFSRGMTSSFPRKMHRAVFDLDWLVELSGKIEFFDHAAFFFERMGRGGFKEKAQGSQAQIVACPGPLVAPRRLQAIHFQFYILQIDSENQPIWPRRKMLS